MATSWRIVIAAAICGLTVLSPFRSPGQGTRLAAGETAIEILLSPDELIEANAPRTSAKGTGTGSIPRPDGGAIARPTIDHIARFVPESGGKNDNPHAPAGIGIREFVQKLRVDPPFESFAFKPNSLGVYQLGDPGTVQKPPLRSAPVEPLPSWNAGPSKDAILDFVARVTKPGSPAFVPVADRIAVFDNDGTLWCEQPVYVQAVFVRDRVQAMAADHPDWKDLQPFKAVLKGDRAGLAALGEKGLVDLLTTTHAGMTSDDFRMIVGDWIASAKHPRFDRLYTRCVYQPMLELIAYLKASGFKTFIVSGGGVEFMRVWTEPVYGIPPEQVVGSTIRTRYELRGDRPVLVRLPEVDFIDDKAGKPVGIGKFIGKRPIAAFGNSDGDYEMLRYVTAGPGPRLGLIVHHTDAEREYAYDRESPVGRLVRALDEAPERGWMVVDMKRDWREVFKP